MVGRWCGEKRIIRKRWGAWGWGLERGGFTTAIKKEGGNERAKVEPRIGDAR